MMYLICPTVQTPEVIMKPNKVERLEPEFGIFTVFSMSQTAYWLLIRFRLYILSHSNPVFWGVPSFLPILYLFNIDHQRGLTYFFFYIYIFVHLVHFLVRKWNEKLRVSWLLRAPQAEVKRLTQLHVYNKVSYIQVGDCKNVNNVCACIFYCIVSP